MGRMKRDKSFSLSLPRNKDMVEGTIAREESLQQRLVVASIALIRLLSLPGHLQSWHFILLLLLFLCGRHCSVCIDSAEEIVRERDLL